MKDYTIEDIINTYEEVCGILLETHTTGDYKRGNMEHKKIIRIFKYLEKHIDLASTALYKLFDSSNVETKLTVAAHCLSLNIHVQESLKIIKQIKDSNNGIQSFDAEMTLEVYNKQGYLHMYPTQT